MNNEAILVITRGYHVGLRVDLNLNSPELILGREESLTICISDDSVSRHHCRIFVNEHGWHVEDLNSMNGTFVNGHKVSRAPLRNQDMVKVGSEIICFLQGDNIQTEFHNLVYRLAVYDSLTQVHNQTFLTDFTAREFARAKRHQRHLALMLFDVDDLSGINEKLGTMTGDHVLITIANRLSQRIRREELLARFSDDCFAIVLPETTLEGAQKFADIVRQNIGATPMQFEGVNINVSVGVGIGFFHPEMNEVSELVQEAQSALFRAKQTGMGQVSF